MNTRRQSVTNSLFIAVALAVLCAVGYPQRPQNSKKNLTKIEPAPQEEKLGEQERQVSIERLVQQQKIVRDVYVRLMRYHTAARDEQAATSDVSYTPEDYVVFELRDLHTGPIEEIADHSLAELVTKPTGEVLKVTAQHLQFGKGPKHAYYDVEWSSNSSAAQYNESMTIGGFLRSAGDSLTDVDRYTSYEVTTRLAGKVRTYRATALHLSQLDSSGKVKTEILDNITAEINAVLADESPRVRSPWKTYVKSGLYLAVVRQIQKAEKAGRPLIPADAPIGYLPGDDVLPNARGEQVSIAVACPPTTVAITFNDSGIPLCGNDPPPPGAGGYVCSATMTAQGSPAGGSYSWSTASTNVSLSNTTSQTVTVIGQSESASANDVIVVVTYTINQQQATAQQAVTVQKPTYMGFVSVDYDRAKSDCRAGYAGWEKGITWQVQDRFHNAMIFAMATWDTMNNNTPNSCGLPAQGDGTPPEKGLTTEPDGKWPHKYAICSTACVSGNCQATGTQGYTVNGFDISLPYTMTCTSITVNGR